MALVEIRFRHRASGVRIELAANALRQPVVAFDAQQQLAVIVAFRIGVPVAAGGRDRLRLTLWNVDLRLWWCVVILEGVFTRIIAQGFVIRMTAIPRMDLTPVIFIDKPTAAAAIERRLVVMLFAIRHGHGERLAHVGVVVITLTQDVHFISPRVTEKLVGSVLNPISQLAGGFLIQVILSPV